MRGTALAPDRDHLHSRETVTNIETLPKMNVIVYDHDPNCHPLHGRETVTKEQTIPKMKGVIVYDYDPDHDQFLVHHVEIQFCQGYRSRLHQTVNISTYKTLNNLCNSNENQVNKAVSKRRTNEEVKEVLGDEGIKAGQGKKSRPRKQCPSLKK